MCGGMRRLVGVSLGVAGMLRMRCRRSKVEYPLIFETLERNWLGRLAVGESVEVLSLCWRLFPCLGINMVHSAI